MVMTKVEAVRSTGLFLVAPHTNTFYLDGAKYTLFVIEDCDGMPGGRYVWFSGYGLWAGNILEFEKVLESVPDNIKESLLFHLDLFA
jgi:hypothetical protein